MFRSKVHRKLLQFLSEKFTETFISAHSNEFIWKKRLKFSEERKEEINKP